MLHMEKLKICDIKTNLYGLKHGLDLSLLKFTIGLAHFSFFAN